MRCALLQVSALYLRQPSRASEQAGQPRHGRPDGQWEPGSSAAAGRQARHSRQHLQREHEDADVRDDHDRYQDREHDRPRTRVRKARDERGDRERRDEAERLEEERKATGADIREVYAEAKSSGFDTKIMRKVIMLRRMDAAERQEQDALILVYIDAIGM